MARNNQGRTKAAPAKTKQTTKSAPKTTTSVLEFVTPTDFVELPSAGRFYGSSHPLHGSSTVEIRYMTARDEDILTSQTLLRKGMALEKFLENVLVDKAIDPSSLLIGDRNAILVAARITGYGSDYETKVNCPACGAKSTYIFDLSDARTHSGEGSEDYTAEETTRGTFNVELPLTKVTAEVRLLTGKDETSISQNSTKRRASALENNLTDQLTRCIVALNDDTDANTIKRFVELMPARDSRYLRNAIKAVTPNIDMSQNFHCSECGHEQDMEVPFTADFFWPNR